MLQFCGIVKDCDICEGDHFCFLSGLGGGQHWRVFPDFFPSRGDHFESFHFSVFNFGTSVPRAAACSLAPSAYRVGGASLRHVVRFEANAA